MDNIINAFIAMGTAMGTVGAVLYALYRDIFKRPKLKIELEPHPEQLPGAKTHYRICVRNTRKVTAKNCSLQIEELFDFKKGRSPSFYEPVQLEWKSPSTQIQAISGKEALKIESPYVIIDIPPTGSVKARFLIITEDNKVFLNYDITFQNGKTPIFSTPRSIPLTPFLVEPNSKFALKLVAYAENSNSATSYCILKKDTKRNLELSLTTKRPKIK